MNLNTKDWKEFVLEKLFTIKKGKRLTAEDQEDGNNNYIGAIDSNNGIANHIAQSPIHQGNTISLSYNGSVGEAFYQKDPYWATDDVNALYSKYDGFNEPIGLFFATVLRQEKYKFSYGRKWTLDNMKRTVVKLPIKHNEDGTPLIDTSKKYSGDGYVPDWEWMEFYVKSLHHKPLTTQNKSGIVPSLNIQEWKEFKVSDVLQCDSTKLSIKDDLSEGRIPFISRSAENNGCDGYVEVDLEQITKCNCLTIGAEGVYSFYQPVDFATGNKVYQLRNEHMNPYIGLFLSTILNAEDYRYSYGRARILSKLKDEIIKLPIVHNEDGTPFIDRTYRYSNQGYIPDWQWMADYIKSLPYGDRI